MVQHDMNDLLEQAESLQNLVLAHATGSNQDDGEYRQLRQVFTSDDSLSLKLPRFIRTCRDLDQFWAFIKTKYPTYQERRQYLWDEFRPLLDLVESSQSTPSDESISDALLHFDAAHVNAAWSKALSRRKNDPEGAITAARTLLESVCKHILDEKCVSYEEAYDLPKLYRLCAESLNLSPGQHTEKIFKQILGACFAVVEGLGSMRNKLSDSHGRGPSSAKPLPRHAELAVNLAGSAALYLISTLQEK